jgi:hypothetical protein
VAADGGGGASPRSSPGPLGGWPRRESALRYPYFESPMPWRRRASAGGAEAGRAVADRVEDDEGRRC